MFILLIFAEISPSAYFVLFSRRMRSPCVQIFSPFSHEPDGLLRPNLKPVDPTNTPVLIVGRLAHLHRIPYEILGPKLEARIDSSVCYVLFNNLSHFFCYKCILIYMYIHIFFINFTLHLLMFLSLIDRR